MTPRSYYWKQEETAPELDRALQVLSEFYPLQANEGGKQLQFIWQENENLRVREWGDRICIEYGSLSAALRGTGMALSGLFGDAISSFKRLGIMLDCSRNAVMKVAYVKRWIRQLALLGYNQLMLYTEDTYELSDEPFFGYKRGGYTLEEIREIDAYAAALGVEVIACIQTLGHLHQILKWKRFDAIRDTNGVVLVDEEETYRLIERMISFWKKALRTERIHIGMDEAHDLGCGKFLDRNGYEPQYDIFSRHLAKVCAICNRHGLAPMIWSDMFFRMGNARHDYYDRATIIPDTVRERIPAGVSLVYWDYYNTDKAFYIEWIHRHRALAGEPVMASGIWTWMRFWYDHATTAAAVRPCIEACREERLSELFFTLWGDGGSYCEFDSAWAGLVWAADLAFGGSGDEHVVAAMARGVCNVDASLCLLGEHLQVDPQDGGEKVFLSTLLWDDPLLGIGWEGYQGKKTAEKIRVALETLKHRVECLNPEGDVPSRAYLLALVRTALARVNLRQQLVAAWEAKDRAALKWIADELVPEVDAEVVQLNAAFRAQWLRRNKAFGMEAMQIRFGALRARCEETAVRIREYLAGEIATIDELDDQREVESNPVRYFYWLATGSVNF